VSRLYSSPESKELAMVRPSSERRGLKIKEDDLPRQARRPATWTDDYEGAERPYLEHPGDPRWALVCRAGVIPCRIFSGSMLLPDWQLGLSW
jgi:hypothetical protein